MLKQPHQGCVPLAVEIRAQPLEFFRLYASDEALWRSRKLESVDTLQSLL
jgi:hypothetical protein